MHKLTSKRFYTGLVITLLVSSVTAGFAGELLGVSEHNLLMYLSIGFFTALAIGVFHLSERAAKMNSRNFFMQIVMINTMVKMFGSVALVIGYFTITKPSTNKFIVPFLIVYVLYTIFDAYFMMKQSRNISGKKEG